MLKLDQTTRKLQAVLSGAVTTNQLPCMVSYSDDNGTTYVGGTQLTNTNSTTAVDICAAPGASTVRDIDYLSIRNRDTAAATVTVMLDDNGTDYEIVKAALAVGDQLVYVHGSGWNTLDSAGQVKSSATSGGDFMADGSVPMTGALKEKKGSDIASAATVDLGTATGNSVDVTHSTGTTAITSLGGASLQAGTEIETIFSISGGTLTITHHATNLYLAGGADITLANGDVIRWRKMHSSNAEWKMVGGVRASGAAWASSIGLPRSYLAGFVLSNNGTDATNDIDIASGACRDSTNAADIVLATALTKRLDANWAAGTNQGMRYSGAAIADTTYHIWAVSTAAGTQDIYATPNASASTASAALTLLQAETGGSGYVYARRIGSILRVSSAIVAFVQNGDIFSRNASILDVDVTNPTTSAVTRTLSVPLGIKVIARFNYLSADPGAANPIATYFSDLAVSDEAASITVAPLASSFSVPSANQGGANYREVMTNTSAQIRSRVQASSATSVLKIATLGWIDRRGRDD